MVVRAAIASAPLRMTSLWIRHDAPLAGRDFTRPEVQNPSVAYLLLFEPVLLEAGQRCEAGIGRVLLATAFLVVEVGAAVRAKSAAIASADHLHGERQIHLLGQHVG